MKKSITFMENSEEIDRLITENLKLSRSVIFLKREVILLRTEREDRENRLRSIESSFGINSLKVDSLQKSYDNIKLMQNYISSEYATLQEKFEHLEEIVLNIKYEK